MSGALRIAVVPGDGIGVDVTAEAVRALQAVADASGGLVTVGPKIEVASCNWWVGGTDLTGAGNTGVGQLYSAYYKDHP